MDISLVFMGTPDFAVPALKHLAQSYQVNTVITQPDRRAGRGRKLTPSPVKSAAIELGLEVFQPEDVNQHHSLAHISKISPDLIIVSAFGQILKPDLLKIPRKGCLNIHASLLPRWRGAAPINAALLAGDSETGVTIMKMGPGLDTGPILAQRVIPIQQNDTAGTLFERLASAGAELILDTIPKYMNGSINPIEQDDSQATYASMLSRQDGSLDFSQTADYIARQVRAFHPWPGTYMSWNGNRLLIHQAQALNVTSPGEEVLTIHEGWPAVGTARGLIKLIKIQPAGKKIMSGKAFLNGNPGWGLDPTDLS
jgi:methionyl-tRNA formyltransferase